jgi:hypothetical protein
MDLLEETQAKVERAQQEREKAVQAWRASQEREAASQERRLLSEGLILRIAYAIANREDAAQVICKWVREYGQEDGYNRPLMDAIGRRMETAQPWPVPERFKLDKTRHATASDRREPARMDLPARHVQAHEYATPEGIAAAATRPAVDLARPCTCYVGLGFYGKNVDPWCPRHSPLEINFT